MTEEEIEAVAQELAKVGGLAWYPGRTKGPLLRTVSARYRDRARVAIAALERLKATKESGNALQDMLSSSSVPSESAEDDIGDHLQAGVVVVYRPPGERRAMPYRIEKIQDGRAYLVPCPHSNVGWVSLKDLSPESAGVSFPDTGNP